MAPDTDEEVFLALDDDEAVAKPKVLKKTKPKVDKKKPSKSKKLPPVEVMDAEILDSSIVRQATGEFEVGWPLLGMDCPDCASKATRALKTLVHINESTVSATAGTVKLTVQLEYGTLSSASSVLHPI